MNERIKELRKALDLTQQEFADKLNIKRGAIANYEIGRNTPIDAVISLICREFNVNETWLRTGKGEMFCKLSADEEIGYIVGGVLDHDEKESPFYDVILAMMRSYHELDDKSKDTVLKFFADVQNNMKKKEED